MNIGKEVELVTNGKILTSVLHVSLLQISKSSMKLCGRWSDVL